LVGVVLALCVVVVIAGWLRGNDFLHMLEVGISLAGGPSRGHDCVHDARAGSGASRLQRAVETAICARSAAVHERLAVGGRRGFVLQLAAVYWPLLRRVLHTVPLAAVDWALITACAFAPVVVVELVKLIGRAAAPPLVPTARVLSVKEAT